VTLYIASLARTDRKATPIAVLGSVNCVTSAAALVPKEASVRSSLIEQRECQPTVKEKRIAKEVALGG
jgi:hypothetical protein